jgi:hypothetical protein
MHRRILDRLISWIGLTLTVEHSAGSPFDSLGRVDASMTLAP